MSDYEPWTDRFGRVWTKGAVGVSVEGQPSVTAARAAEETVREELGWFNIRSPHPREKVEHINAALAALAVLVDRAERAERERARLADALRELVELKDGPRDKPYTARKVHAWNAARAALAALVAEAERAGRQVGRAEEAERKLAEAWEHLDAAEARAEQAGRERVESREGMMEVYDWTGRYAGCLGVETWQRLVMEAKAGAA